MLVYTRNSVYAVEVGEGFTVEFQFIQGKVGHHGWHYRDQKYHGLVNVWPPRVGESMVIYRRDEDEWPTFDRLLCTSTVTKVTDNDQASA